MIRTDMIQMFIIIALSKAIDDQVLMVNEPNLKQMNKVIFKRLKHESNKIHKIMDSKLERDEEMLNLMSEAISDAIQHVKNNMEIKND